jgi:hypothetical protein
MVKRQSDEPFFKAPREFPKRGPGGFPIGPRTRRRAAENAQLRKTVSTKLCELKIEGVCTKTGVCWAHSQKSRFLTTSRDWQEAARSCLPCHDHAEKLSHKEMRALIVAAIRKRKP